MFAGINWLAMVTVYAAGVCAVLTMVWKALAETRYRVRTGLAVNKVGRNGKAQIRAVVESE